MSNNTSKKKVFRLGSRIELLLKLIFALIQSTASFFAYNFLDKLDAFYKIPTPIKGILVILVYLAMPMLFDYIINSLNKNSAYNLKCDKILELQEEISKAKGNIESLNNEISLKNSTIDDKNNTIRKIIKSLTAKFIDIQKKSDPEKIEILTQVIKIISINEDKLCSNTKCSIDIIKATNLDELLAVPTSKDSNQDFAKNTTASKDLENLPDYRR